KCTGSRMRLLPPDHEQGWTPYGWLVYLLMFAMYPLMAGQSLLHWALTLAGIVAFLPFYFWGYWLEGRRILLPIAGILAIGMAFAPFNAGASVFFIYAAAFIGEIAEPGVGVRY